MPELARIVILVHVLAAFATVAGYVGTNVMTEFARRTDDPQTRRSALSFSSWFDRMALQTSGTVAGLTGLVAVPVFGYSYLTPWVLASIALWLVIMGLGIVYWARYGRRVEAAVGAGDEASLTRVLREPRSVLVSRIENLLLLALLVLMILRPGA